MAGTPVRLVPRDERPPLTSADKEVEDDDPYELVGVRFPVAAGQDADRDLARAFVEEYALLGWPGSKVRMLFETPQFAGAHDIAHRRGPAFIDEIIADVFGAVTPGEDL